MEGAPTGQKSWSVALAVLRAWSQSPILLELLYGSAVAGPLSELCLSGHRMSQGPPLPSLSAVFPHPSLLLLLQEIPAALRAGIQVQVMDHVASSGGLSGKMLIPQGAEGIIQE